jgi:hypothetical protein
VKESVVEAWLVKRVTELGGRVRKVRWVGRVDAPDRFVAVPPRMVKGRPRSALQCFVELKKPGEKPTATQALEHEDLRAAGVFVYVIDSPEGVDRLLR